MASQGSFTTAMLGVGGGGTNTFPPPLASSISSLNSTNSSRNSVNHVSKTYRQASALFLTRRFPEALSTVTPLITPIATTDNNNNDGGGAADGAPADPALVTKSSRSTRVKVWTLYIAILNAIAGLEIDEGKEAFGTQEWRSICQKVIQGEVWDEVVGNGYHGVEGDVDADVVINLATLLLTHAKSQKLNQSRLEAYLAASSTPHLDLSHRFSSPSRRSTSRQRQSSKIRSGTETPRDLNSRLKILELYTLHVLLRNDEWNYARDFITESTILDDERREAFLQALQSLWEDHEAKEDQDREAQRRQEERVNRDIEEARRRRKMNQEREQKRSEGGTSPRDNGEVDYGGTRATGPRRSDHPFRPDEYESNNRPKPGQPSKSATPATTGARAAQAWRNLHSMLDKLGTAVRANPFPLLRFIGFIAALVMVLGKRRIRERLSRILGATWGKVKATAAT